ncbi:ubiquitin carboxyl-terminal hydrolase 8-like isoform X2 [Hetaerina americana]
MKFVEVVLHVKKNRKLEEQEFLKYFGQFNLADVMKTLEKLTASLCDRYAKQEEEEKRKTKPGSSRKQQKLLQENGNSGENPEKTTANGTSELHLDPSTSVTSCKLRDLIQEGKFDILVLDTRSAKDFVDSHMCFNNCSIVFPKIEGLMDRVTVISVPKDIIKNGMIPKTLRKELPNESLHGWNKRSEFDLIVLMDWDTCHSSMKKDSSISILKDIMMKWDIETSYKRTPVVLDGGYYDWVNTFPMFSTDPHVDLPTKSKTRVSVIPNRDLYLSHLLSEDDVLDDLDDVEYPAIIDSPPKPSALNEPAVGSMSSLQAAMTARPTVPENRPAPLVDRSSKPTATPISPQKPSLAPQPILKKINNLAPAASNEVSREAIPREITEEMPTSGKERNDLPSATSSASKPEVLKDKNEPPESRTGRSFSPSSEEVEEKKPSKNVHVPTVDRSLKSKVLQPQGHPGGDGGSVSTSSPLPVTTEIQKPSVSVSKPEEGKKDDARRRDSVEKVDEGLRELKPFSDGGEERKQLKKTVEKDIWTTPIKFEPSPGSSAMKRSHSLQNVSRLTDDHECPKFNRSIKPTNKTTDVIPTRRRTLDGVFGNVGRGLTGLRNLGNSCYMNSILQCINHTTSLVKYFCDGQYREDVNRSTKLRGEVAEEVAALVRALWSGEYRSIACRDLKGVVGMHKKAFAGHEQQDSHEFLTILMDWLHEDLNRASHRANKMGNSPSHQPAQNASGPEGAIRAWNDFCHLNESLVLHLFYGQQASTVCCLQCGEQSVTYEPFSNLSLPIPPNATRCSLADCMSLYLKGEHISGWNCPKCKEPRDASKKFDIWILPRILVIHFKRFTSDGWCRKRQTMVDFPLEDLDVSQWVGTEVLTSGYNPARKRNSVLYNLYGVSNHYGTMDGGHYTAHCKSSNFNKWFKFDDHEVSELSPSEVVSPAAYILFYSSVDVS